MRLGFVRSLVCGILLASPCAIASQPYSAVYYLGASGLDTGNWLLDDQLKLYGNYSGFAPTPDKGYYRGRWQSGRSLSDYLSEALGKEARPSLDGGTNFAYGVAWLGPLAGEPAPQPTTLAGQQMLYLSTQVTALLQARNNTLDRNALYVISIGGNDASNLFNRTSEGAARAAMALDQIQRMIDHRARNFAVVLLGSLLTSDPARKAYSETYTTELRGGLAALSGVDVTTINPDHFLASRVSALGTFAQFLISLGLDPTRTGTCLANQACSSAAIAAATADLEYRDSPHFSFDSVHLDTKYNEALAGYVLAQLRTQNLPRGLTARALSLPDANLNGTGDLVGFRLDPTVAEIRDSAGGSLIGTRTFFDGDAYTPAGAAVVPDSDGDGAPEVAVLAVRNSDGRMVVEVQNVGGTGAPRQIWFASGHTPVAIASIDEDADDNGIPELAVLSHRNSDGRALVQVQNAFGTANSQSIWGPQGALVSRNLAVLPDADNDDVPEVAVMASRLSDDRTVVWAASARSGSARSSVWFAAGQAAIDLAAVPDSNADGVPELAVLSSRKSDGRLRVEVRNASVTTPHVASFWLAHGFTGVAIATAAAPDGDAVPEVALLAQRDSDGRILVSVRNADGSASQRSLWYPSGFTARDLLMLPDLDVNGVEEAAVLMSRDSDGRMLLQSRNIFGAVGTGNYWFGP